MAHAVIYALQKWSGSFFLASNLIPQISNMERRHIRLQKFKSWSLRNYSDKKGRSGRAWLE